MMEEAVKFLCQLHCGLTLRKEAAFSAVFATLNIISIMPQEGGT